MSAVTYEVLTIVLHNEGNYLKYSVLRGVFKVKAESIHQGAYARFPWIPPN